MNQLKISPINKLLNELAGHITKENLKQMKFLLSDHIPAGEMEQCTHARDVFTKLRHLCLIGEHNLTPLEELLNEMGLICLNTKIQEFKKRIINGGKVNDIPQEQISTLPAPRHIVVTLLIEGDYTQFNPEVVSNIQQAISEALGIQLNQVGYLLSRPFNSYYVMFQLPESSQVNLTQAANEQQDWLYDYLQCIEVQINDSEPIRLRQNQNDLIQPESIPVDEAEPRGDDLETAGGLQASLSCHFQEPNKVHVIFTFRGNLRETEATIAYPQQILLNLCANLGCCSSTEVHYLGFIGGLNNDHHMEFLLPKCYFEALNQCCREMKNWLRDMNISEIQVKDEPSGTMNVIYRCCN